MKGRFIILTILAYSFIGCSKNHCRDLKIEITGANAQIDQLDFRLVSGLKSYSNPSESVTESNINLPYIQGITFCKKDFDYNLRCYDSDTSIILTLKLYSDNVLIKQTTGSPIDFVELAGGIND